MSLIGKGVHDTSFIASEGRISPDFNVPCRNWSACWWTYAQIRLMKPCLEEETSANGEMDACDCINVSITLPR
jgi:hypothetical protein